MDFLFCFLFRYQVSHIVIAILISDIAHGKVFLILWSPRLGSYIKELFLQKLL